VLTGNLLQRQRAFEGYPSGEMKHGPIALVEAGMPVVALATCGPTLASMASNIQELKAREGFVTAVVTDKDEATRGVADVQIPIPRAPYWLQPCLAAIPLQSCSRTTWRPSAAQTSISRAISQRASPLNRGSRWLSWLQSPSPFSARLFWPSGSTGSAPGRS